LVVAAEAAPDATGAIPAATVPEPLRAQLNFTGEGREYFRIWIVHTLLTILSVGIYSAWAKVRKARWFAQHTHLLGDSFDFHGRPLRILAGRAVALVLFIAYSHAFDWNVTAGLVAILLLLVLGPLLFGSAQRFRLANTSWRGLRFGFDAPRARVYAVCIPLVLVWTGSTVWAALNGSVAGTLIVASSSLLLWPAIHCELKTLQHRHSRFGALHFGFDRSVKAFYGLYARMLGMTMLIGMGAGILAALVLGILSGFGAVEEGNATQTGLFVGLFMVFLVYVTCWPYFAARMQQLVWRRTSLGEMRFDTRIQAGALFRLVLGQMLLVLVTLGLYWPFAAVAIARYRIESLGVEAAGVWPVIEAPAAADGSAVGDAALDFFDLDLGW